MEFFGHTDAPLSAARLHAEAVIGELPRLCASIDRVLSNDGDRGEIYCLWGQFRIHRETLRHGVRFTLPDCPNALAWTVTCMDQPPGGVRVHCTIDRTTHDPDFIESIETFVSDWVDGLRRLASEN